MGNFMRKWREGEDAEEKKIKRKRSLGAKTVNTKPSKVKEKPIKKSKMSEKTNSTGHSMSPSPESSNTAGASNMEDTQPYSDDDTDHYSDDSQEGKYWAKELWKCAIISYIDRKNGGKLFLPDWSPKYLNAIINTIQKDETQQLKDRLRLVSKWSQQDTRAYREGYPGKVDVETSKDNLLFYTNVIASKPDGDKIDDILTNWKGDYEKLERHHGYIQWLFPIREPGMNWYCQELQLHEAKAIAEDEAARNRFISAYELMLDFYGLQLKNRQTGEIERGENWEERLSFLNRSYHNFLRITRILKALGEMGFEHMKYPFIQFMLREALYEQTIPNAAKSCVEYWAHTLRKREERAAILNEVKVFIESDHTISSSSDESQPSSPAQTPPSSDSSQSESSKTQTKPKASRRNKVKYNEHFYSPLQIPDVPTGLKQTMVKQTEPKQTEGDERTEPKQTEGDEQTEPKQTEGDERTEPKQTEGDERTEPKQTEGDERTEPKQTEGDERTEPKQTEGDERTEPKQTEGDERTEPKQTEGDERTEPKQSKPTSPIETEQEKTVLKEVNLEQSDVPMDTTVRQSDVTMDTTVKQSDEPMDVDNTGKIDSVDDVTSPEGTTEQATSEHSAKSEEIDSNDQCETKQIDSNDQ